MSVVAEPLKSDVRSRATPLLAFIGTFSILLYCALRGASYDIVVRQEEALVLWWVLALGWISGALPRYRAQRLSWIPIAALTALAAWTALSLSWTDSDERTLAEVARAFHYLALVLLVWSLFGHGTWRAAAAGVFAAAFLVTALSVTSRLLPGFFPENRIRGVFGSNRLSYPFNYWNDVSAW